MCFQTVIRLCLFFIGFYICGETNMVRYLVTNQTVVYNAGSTKNLSLKCSYYATVSIYFFN